MRLLLDTHTLLWWLLGDARLSTTARGMLTDRTNHLVLSSVSGFEIASKIAAGKLKLPDDPEVFISAGMRDGGVSELPLLLRHTYRAGSLPLIHRDPFDRLLVAIAAVEDLTLLTDDHWLRKYPVATAW